MDYINKILCGNDLEILTQLPAESVNCCVCSPPYWGLRDYGIDPVIWDGDENCKHIWGNKTITLKHKSGETNPGKESWFKDKGASDDKGNCFCIKCGAWRGSLGLEPTFYLYIKHLCQIFDEVKRVLRKGGTCWVNIGDSYGGSGNRSGHTLETSNLNRLTIGYGATEGNQKATRGYEKSLLDIPYRFSIEMINRGWIKRNTIIWWKPNCMPSSAPNRFTIDFEYLFFFTKNNKAIFWTNEKTLDCVSKNPLGIKGIEGKDWEWRPCPRCQGTGGETKINKKDAENMGSPRARYHRITKQEECKRCKGLGKIKVSFWASHDYWFEQQFDDIAEATIKRAKYNWCSPGTKSFNHSSGLNRDEPYKDHINFSQGRNKRCVWIIPTQPFPEAHFAVYPEGLIEIPIKAGCPEFVCKKCGKARVKIFELEREGSMNIRVRRAKVDYPSPQVKASGEEKQNYNEDWKSISRKFIGYSDCGCNAGFESGIVLDPFMGAGTTALVALKQRKRFIGIEIKQEYIDMAKRRIAKVQQRIF